MADIILILLILAAVGAAAGYLLRAKKQGKGCVGCPCSGNCAGKARGCGSVNKGANSSTEGQYSS